MSIEASTKVDLKRFNDLAYFFQEAEKEKGLDPLLDTTDVVTVANTGVSTANLVKGALSVFTLNPISAVVEFGSAGLLRMNNREYRRQLQEFAKENAKLKQEREKFAEENGKLKHEREEFSRENGKLVGHVDNLKIQVGALSHENAQLRAEVGALITQVDRFVRENDLLGARNETYAKNNQTLQDRVTELSSIINNGKEMVREYREEVTNLKVERATIRAELQGETAALTKVRKEVEEACKELRKVKNEHRMELAKFKASNDILAQNVNEFAAENRKRQNTQQPNASRQNGVVPPQGLHYSHHQMQYPALLDTSVTA